MIHKIQHQLKKSGKMELKSSVKKIFESSFENYLHSILLE